MPSSNMTYLMKAVREAAVQYGRVYPAGDCHGRLGVVDGQAAGDPAYLIECFHCGVDVENRFLRLYGFHERQLAV